MADSTLYKMCLRQIAINLKNGVYKSRRENPFTITPIEFVNDIAFSVLECQNSERFKADDLEQLLTSRRLTELRISITLSQPLIELLEETLKVLDFLKAGCWNLKTFHVSVFTRERAGTVATSGIPGAWVSSGIRILILKTKISKALENVVRRTPNLEEFHCCFNFDLKALINCKKLSRLRLHFYPEQKWWGFLQEMDGNFGTNEVLEFFTVCGIAVNKRIPYDDVTVILKHCPNITSLGFIESSGALSLLHRKGVSLELKLKSCYWKFVVEESEYYPSRIREAVMKCPTIEELEYGGCCVRSLPLLKNLRNLTYLSIFLQNDVSDFDFYDLLQEIGPQLKHLYFRSRRSMDISLLLQNCFNLESLRIEIKRFRTFPSLLVSLPELRHLTLDHLRKNLLQIFSILYDCNKLTELFLLNCRDLNDETLHEFLGRNSLSNLKVAFLELCGLSPTGFEEFLRNAPNLEKVKINNSEILRNNYERVATQLEHNAIVNDGKLHEEDEFFDKKSNSCACERY